MHGGVGGEKATFTSFEVRKTSRSVSTHFVADCSFTRILKRVFGGGNGDGGSLGRGGGGRQTLASTISKGKALGKFETRFSMSSSKV